MKGKKGLLLPAQLYGTSTLQLLTGLSSATLVQ